MFEIALAKGAYVEFFISMPKYAHDEFCKQIMYGDICATAEVWQKLDIHRAEASFQKDREMIMKKVDENFGGYVKFNTLLSKYIR